MAKEETERKEESDLTQEDLAVRESCQRCGSSNLTLKDMDLGKSAFSQILKCKVCGSEILIPRRENYVHSESNEEKQTEAAWKACIEQVARNSPEINVHYFSKSQCTLVPGRSENGR